MAGPRAGADPRPPQERPGLRAAGLPARDLAERGAAEAERRAVGGAGGPQRPASGAAEAGQPLGGRRDHGALRGGLLPRRLAGVDAELADHAARRQPHACGNEPAAAARRPVRGLLPALQGRRDPGLGVRAAGRSALRGPAAGGAAAAAPEKVLSDFDTICDRGWQRRSASSASGGAHRCSS